MKYLLIQFRQEHIKGKDKYDDIIINGRIVLMCTFCSHNIM